MGFGIDKTMLAEISEKMRVGAKIVVPHPQIFPDFCHVA
ncbi:hypothetical protein HMPREF0578_0524 [Mobiluncus mulieris 28-1]|nr:hypothetical protein HMPREF0578_0524 [Mobiluncus mulieris 28-1]EFN93864.1 hypothetical protein HMPREF9278_0980 [Mobiluncus mulieris FB024-16]